MFPHKSPGSNRMHAVRRQDIPQLYEGIVIIPVAKQHHRHRQRTTAHDPLP